MLYLAMTASEFTNNPAPAFPAAWMACHFSAYGTGLSNLPDALPPGSMLIFNDRTPIWGHDPVLVAAQLTQAAEKCQCSRILLDLQRPDEPVQAVLEAILQTAPCPVGISQVYAGPFSCPVCLPPLPLTQTWEEYAAPWQGREVWLEAALDAQHITLTETGSQVSAASPPEEPLPFYDKALRCHYGLSLEKKEATFTLHRTWEDLQKILEEVPCAIGLYQELQAFSLGKGGPALAGADEGRDCGQDHEDR